MQRIVLMPNLKKDVDLAVTKQVISILKKNSADLFMDVSYEKKLRSKRVTYLPLQSVIDLNPDAIIVIGGDGSILDAASYSMEVKAPVLGINLGRLGYLSSLDVNELEELNKLFTGEYKVTKHMTFDVFLQGRGKSICLNRRAVNDVVISHETPYGLSDFELSDGLGNSINYRADGLILSTPTGSTAYSLSAGGPAIDSSLDAICVTPICAHSFFNRSILFSPKLKIAVKNISSKDECLYVSIDGKEQYLLSAGDAVAVTRSGIPFKMIVLGNSGILGVMNKKMKGNFNFGR